MFKKWGRSLWIYMEWLPGYILNEKNTQQIKNVSYAAILVRKAWENIHISVHCVKEIQEGLSKKLKRLVLYKSEWELGRKNGVRRVG